MTEITNIVTETTETTKTPVITEDLLALKFAELYEHKLRYLNAASPKRWYIRNDESGEWNPDTTLKTDASIPTGVGSHGSNTPEGSACMCDDKRPGTLKSIGGKLICVPNGSQKDSAPAKVTTSFADSQHIKDAAYKKMVEDQQNAWRT